MSVKIICDSACDMRPAEAAERGVALVPLKTLIDGQEYLDGVELGGEAFYEKLESCKELPTTSQVAPAEFADCCRSLLAEGDEALIITLSGKLSGTAQSAVIAAAEMEGRVWVVDSENVTAGERILLEYALRLRDRGLSAREIAEMLERAKKRVCLIARVDTLEYLMRGGRLSRTAAIAGTMLNIKPVIGLEDGEIKVFGKARGSRQSSNMLTEFIGKKGGIDFDMPLMLAYAGTDDALLKGYVDNSRPLWEGRADSLPVSVVGSTIGTHAGPGAIAVAFFSRNGN